MLEYGDAFLAANDRALKRLEDLMGPPAFLAALWMAWDAAEPEAEEDRPHARSKKIRRPS
ncbi:hypothetical protein PAPPERLAPAPP_00260 [Brevundimonas phage vB_BpoS-Papperlapapp]|uniref:Uncharacterized protein n=2 Tax=Marchewkavirus TaxID=3425052 RepID=A0A9E7SLY1_9CAUD|nr:hypothetical protein KABACHOK_04460 [Brevundimonas phage vB_BpoS-Kabachok]USN14956.1 hypothetical protein DOMOVOI_05030 [Brevundimonas phage vB_BpoS-Domovoi]USN15771.1 hypothetical protein PAPPERLAPAPP_00260 [Brevundimonas phage vB_BpoS-Papperlapapp]